MASVNPAPKSCENSTPVLRSIRFSMQCGQLRVISPSFLRSTRSTSYDSDGNNTFGLAPSNDAYATYSFLLR